MRTAFLLLLLVAAGCPSESPGLPVSGRVVAIDGLPLAGVRVAAGRGSDWARPVVTDAFGRFEVKAPGVPYDLALVSGGPSDGRATVLQGLRRLDPVVQLLQDTLGAVPPVHSARVLGTWPPSCGGAACPADAVANIQVSLGDDRAESPQYLLAGLGGAWTPFPWDVSWSGAAPVPALLRVAAWAPFVSSTPPTSWWYGETTSGSLGDGGEVTLDLPELASVPTRNFSVAVEGPAWADAQLRICGVLRLGSAWMGYLVFGVDGGSMAFPAPDHPSVQMGVFAQTTTATGGGAYTGNSWIDPASGSLTLRLRPDAALLAPGVGATVGPGTQLAWTPAEPSVGRAALVVGNTIIHVVGVDQVVLPDLAPLGLALPAGQPCTWGVDSVGGARDVDAYAQLAELTLGLEYWGAGTPPRPCTTR